MRFERGRWYGLRAIDVRFSNQFSWEYISTYRDRFRVVILKLNSKEYIDGVLKSKVNFEFLVNLFVSENDRIH